MRTALRLAAVGLAAGMGAAVATPPRAPSARTAADGSAVSAVSLDWSGPSTPRLNSPTPYTLTVRNVGPRPVGRVTVQVRPPAGGWVSDTTGSREVGGVHLWDVPALAAGEARPLRLTLTAGRTGGGTCQAWVTFTGTAGLAVAARDPKLLARIEAPAVVPVGEPFAAHLVAANTGDCPLDGVGVTHTCARLGADGVTAVRPLPSGPLRPGAEVRTTATHTPAEAGDCRLTFTAWAADGTEATATRTVRAVVPTLTAAVTGPATRLIGRPASYAVTVTNPGELAVADARVSVPVPAGLRNAVARDGGTIDGDRLAWPLGTLNPGAVRTVRFDAVATTPGVQAVTATVVGGRGVTATGECRTAVDGVPALRVELVDLHDPVPVGGETTYEVRLTNTGTRAEENVKLVCKVPAESVRLVKAGGPTAHTAWNGIHEGGSAGVNLPYRVEFDPIRELPPQTEAVFRVKVKAGAAGDVRFKATVTSKHLSTPVVTEESTRVFAD